MRFATTLAFTGSIALFFGGCAEEGSDTDTATETMQQQASEAASQAGDAWEATRDAFVAETESRIEALEARVAELQADAAREEATEEARSLAAEAEDAVEAVKEQLERLRDAGADEWQSIRDSLANALRDLEAGIRPGG